MKSKALLFISAIAILAVVTAYLFWSNGTVIPKPRGYFRIELPEKNYRIYQSACPLRMEVPDYSRVEIFKDRMSNDSCWFNLYYPGLNARIHCTYAPVGDRFEKLINDTYSLAASHEMKASGLRRTLISDSVRSVYGIVYDIEGEAASQLQFFLTDSVNHFFRGSLYFFNSPNPDSIAPVLTFLREDVMQIANTLQWSLQSEESR